MQIQVPHIVQRRGDTNPRGACQSHLLSVGVSVVASHKVEQLNDRGERSRRAVAYIEQSGMSSKQVNGAKKVLTAAALTYVAAALTSIIQLLYLMARYNRNSNR